MTARVQPLPDSRVADRTAPAAEPPAVTLADAQAVLGALADLQFQSATVSPTVADAPGVPSSPALAADDAMPILEARYRTLVEQISAIVFMAYLDRGIGEGYVGPQIEKTLGF